MLNYLILLLLALIIIPLVNKNPDFSFWLFITLLFDPTGHIAGLLSRSNLGGFNYIDIFIFLSFLPLLSNKVNTRAVFSDKLLGSFLKFFFFFMIYRIIVHGMIVPEQSLNYVLRYQIVRERIPLFGFLLIIPVYVMAKRNLNYFYYFIIFATIIPLSLYFMTLFSGLDLIPVGTMDRYRGQGGSGVIRTFMLSSGLSLFIVPIAVCVYLLKLNAKYKKIIYIGFVLTVMSIILTLTKGMFLYLLGVILITLWILNKWFFHANIIKPLSRLVFPIVILWLLLMLTFPKYISYSQRLTNDIYSLIFKGGELEEGRVEGRIQNQLPAHLYTITKYPLFGTGLGRLYEQTEFAVEDYDVTDLPITGHIAQFGIIGISIYMIFYYLIFILIKRVYFKFKANKYNILKNSLNLFLVSIVAISFLVNKFTFVIDKLFSELTLGKNIFPMMIMIGILLSVLSKLNVNNSQSVGKSKYDNN